MRNTLIRSVLVTGSFVLAFDVAHAAENVVLESNTARYEAGQTLDAASPVVLSEGETIVLATEDGMLLVVNGPHSGPAAGEPPRGDWVRRLLTQLFGTETPEAGGLAGVRGGAEDSEAVADTRPDPWLIHAGRTGDQCVLRDRPARLWREDTEAGAEYEIVDVATGASATLAWGERAQADWPFDDSPADDRVYLVRPAGELRSVAIRLHTLAPSLADAGVATVGWLAARGCMPQARLLLQKKGSEPFFD